MKPRRQARSTKAHARNDLPTPVGPVMRRLCCSVIQRPLRRQPASRSFRPVRSGTSSWARLRRRFGRAGYYSSPFRTLKAASKRSRVALFSFGPSVAMFSAK